MMTELLKNQIEKILQEKAAGDVQKTLYVLKGISMETADPENAGKVDLEKLEEGKLMYLFGIQSQGRRFITYEEFLLLGTLTAEVYDTIYILNNNLYFGLYPLALNFLEEHIKGLLNHSFEDADGFSDDLMEIAQDKFTDLFRSVRRYEDGFVGIYNDEEHLQNRKIVTVNLFGETDQEIPAKDASDQLVDLCTESDYFGLVQSLLADSGDKVVRIGAYEGDLNILNSQLRILAANFGNVYVLQAKTIEPSFEHREEYTEILQRYWKKDASFRNIPVYDMAALEQGKKEVIQISQECIISDIVEQAENCEEKAKPFRDIFVTASTGSGKSAMFQIPAIYLAEKYNLMTIVISPLISLMNDQISGLEKRGYKKAKTLNSDISPIVKEDIRQKVAEGEYHILYLSPETLLARSDVEQLIGDRTIGMIVVDEAHIVTTWGKQFRPDYWYLGDHIRKLRKRQQENKGRSFIVSTFTATAIYGGMEDMYTETIHSLQMHNPITYLGYVKRDDIDIVVEKSKKDRGTRTEYEPDKFAKIEDLIQRAVITGKKTLVYFPTVGLIRRCYNQLYIDNMTAPVCCYHGSMDKEEKLESYEKYQKGEKMVMLATKAFGMGVDIPDIAIVAHFAPTGNVCDYVQEIGRAARDPHMKGEAYYEYNTHDFKHINTLHGLSRVQKYQLIEVMRKIVDLYEQNKNQNENGSRITRKRNAMLLDAENFAYIFQSPLDGPDESINKVKTALLMIQKDFKRKYSNDWSPISVRPIPIFESGYFQAEPAAQKRLLKAYPGCLKEVESASHICQVNLGVIWKSDPTFSKYSFPQFKYLLYTRSDKLELNQQYTLTPAININVSFREGFNSVWENTVNALRTYIQTKVIDGTYTHMEDLTRVLTETCGLKDFKARAICEVVIASMETWQREYCKGINNVNAVSIQHDNSGKSRYAFKVAVNSWFNWLEKHFRQIQKETKNGEFYLINDGGTLIRETATALGVLEAIGVLTFRMIGGANSQIYIYVNKIQELINVKEHPHGYDNSLLDAVAVRHTVSVKMLTYLYENDFTSEQRWNLLEDYFLGKIPEEVEREVEKECKKQAKD